MPDRPASPSADQSAADQSAPGLRQLLPTPRAAVDPLVELPAEHRPLSGKRPWVLTNMVSTIDGGTAIDGLSGPLGGPADQAVFRAVRSVADVVLAGSRTVIDEQYRPPSPADDVAASRTANGRAKRLTIAVVTSSLGLDPALPLFSDPTYRPLVLTVSTAPTSKRALLEPLADIVDIAPDIDGRVDLGAALAELHRRGHRHVLSEGGPSLNGQLVANDLIDEWNLTLSPILSAGSAARAAHGPPSIDPRQMAITRLWEGGGLLFGRWVRASN